MGVMLCASQGKYELDKSSVGENINYIYYFTYFHKFEVHPFWEEFNKKIEPIIKCCLCVLRIRICCLSVSYCQLKTSVSSFHDNVKCILDSIHTTYAAVECSIDRLEQHIRTQIQKNKECIQISICNIKCNLCTIGSNLESYIKCEHRRIVDELKVKTQELQKKIQFTKYTISFYIQQIVLFHHLMRNVTETFQGYIYKEGSKDGHGYTFYSYVYEAMVMQSYEESFWVAAEIHAKLESIEKIAQDLDLTKGLTFNVESLDSGKLSETIKCVADYTTKLGEILKEIQQWKESVTKTLEATIVKELPEKKYDQSYSLLRTSETDGQKYREYWVYHNYTRNIKETLVRYQTKFSQRLTSAVAEISKLEEEIKKTKQRLQNLVAIVVLYRQMKLCLCKFKGVFVEIGSYIPESTGRPYYTINKRVLLSYFQCLYMMRCTVKLLVCLLCSCKSDLNCDCCDNNLANAICELRQIYCQLHDLTLYGNNIGTLSYLIRAIQHFNKVICSLKRLKHTTDKLKSDQEKLSRYKETLYSIDSDIRVIISQRPCNLKDLGAKLEKIHESYLSMQKLNTDLECIESLYITRLKIQSGKNGENELDSELDELCKKLTCISSNLTEASCYLTEYSAIHHRCYCVIEAVIKDIENVKIIIKSMEDNIKEIKSRAHNIKDQYHTYTSKFKCFRDSLLELQQCLDFLIKGFLTCSLCTTVCRLRKLVKGTIIECPDTNTSCNRYNICQRESLLGDRVSTLEEQLYRYSWLVLGHTSILESKLLVCRLYYCSVASYRVMKTLVEFEKCRCVKLHESKHKAEHFEKTRILTQYNIRNLCNHSEFHRKTVYQSGNNVCLCLLVMYKLYPTIAKCLCCMVDMELELANVMTKKLERYNTLKRVYFSLTKLFIMAIKIIDKLTSFIEKAVECSFSKTISPYCFCMANQHTLYPWFVSVITWLSWLLDNLFSLRYPDIHQSIQLLSNLWSELDEMWPDPDKPCSLPCITPTCPLPPATSSTPIKVKCCLVCLNVKVICISSQLLFSAIESFHKSNTNLKNCKGEDLDCFCDCNECTKCLDELTKVDVKDKLKCDLLKGLKEKLTKLTELTNLKSVNGPKAKWTIVCDCGEGHKRDNCRDVSKDFGNICSPLIKYSGDFNEINCGCESVKPCCCCCKCDECGTGKKRHCNKKEEAKDKHKCQNNSGQGGNTNGDGNGQAGTGTPNGKGDNKCPCTEGKKDGKQCCCKESSDGKKKTCNCTKDKAATTSAKPPECNCCCLSCCALEKDEDKDKDKKPTQPEKESEGKEKDASNLRSDEDSKEKAKGGKEGKKDEENGKKCPCKKKKKKDKPKVHCKNNKKYKDKRCCCKCCPDTNGGEKPANGGGSTPTPATPGAANPNDKECCCCCKCKAKCGSNTASGTTGNGKCKCHNRQNGQTSGHKDCDCKCYCCFECEHEKSALKSVCKQFAYELNSGILVLSKLASNLTIECCEDNEGKLRDTLKEYLEKCNQRFPKTCLTATRTGRGCDISHVMVGGKTSLGGGNSGANPNIGDTNVTLIDSVSPSVIVRDSLTVRAVTVTTIN